MQFLYNQRAIFMLSFVKLILLFVFSVYSASYVICILCSYCYSSLYDKYIYFMAIFIPSNWIVRNTEALFQVLSMT